jgi:hypothetical protein
MTEPLLPVRLEQVWERCCRVRALAFVARSANPTGWNGRGSGTVVVEQAGGGAITFTESGTWTVQDGREIRFHNVFRWSKVEDRLRLEHLRFGVDQPVYLFDLAPAGDRVWRSVSPHLCREDCYTADMRILDHCIILRWSVTGPRKQEVIEYTYSG